MSILHTSNLGAFAHESKRLLKLAIPILIGQFCISCLGLIDTLMSSKVSTVDLAAIALGTTFWTPIILLGVGLTIGLGPIVAHLKGAQKENEIPGIVHNALIPSLVITILSLGFLIFAPDLLLTPISESEPLLKAKTIDYLFYISFGVPAIIIFNILKNTLEGLSITIPAMVIGFLTLMLNIPINYVFIYGKFGFPQMGAVGCGVATAIVMWCSLVMLYIYSIYAKKIKHFALLRSNHPFIKKDIAHICKVGIPISIALVVETLSYSILGYALTPFGSTTVAAHQIANIVAIVTFMIPVSFAAAVAIRIGQSLGEGSYLRAKRAIISGTFLAIMAIYPIALIVYFNQEAIIDIFTKDLEVIKIATPLFLFILIFQIQDPFFGAFQGVVRGFKDTKFLMNFNLIALWLFGVPFGYAVGLTDIFGKCYGIYGMWFTLLACYYLMTIAFIIRTIYLFKHIDKYMSKPTNNVITNKSNKVANNQG